MSTACIDAQEIMEIEANIYGLYTMSHTELSALYVTSDLTLQPRVGTTINAICPRRVFIQTSHISNVQ